MVHTINPTGKCSKTDVTVNCHVKVEVATLIQIKRK